MTAIGSAGYPDDKGKPNGMPDMTKAFGRYLAAGEKLSGTRTFK